jgi:class 3 adenylate cyclase
VPETSHEELRDAVQEPRTFGDENVRQMLVLAERLREQTGGELDDFAIQAVSEACCVPIEYVRVAVSRMPEKRRQGPLHSVRSAFLTLEPDTRQYVLSGVLAANFALTIASGEATGDQYGVFLMLLLIVLAFGLWNVSLAKDSRVAAMSGAIFGGLAFAAHAIFALLFQLDTQISGGLLIPFTLLGALSGVLSQKIVGKFRTKLGIKDPLEERQELLRQLHDLQAKLRTGEQSMTFLSLDVVGSTKMKEQADPLSVEFTFTEYHKFVEAAVKKYGGRVHSTAGDGVTCAFEHPQHAYAAARYIQAGIIELNMMRNKIGRPLVLRAGIHYGTVMVPPGQDITKINFAHVIDMAAHLQKVCPHGGIAVSEAAAAYVPGGPDAIGAACVEAQEIKARVWAPRAALAPGAAPTPAPPTA